MNNIKAERLWRSENKKWAGVLTTYDDDSQQLVLDIESRLALCKENNRRLGGKRERFSSV